MKTDPAKNISATVGVPLSQAALHSNRTNSAPQGKVVKPKEGISDTLETSDREANGRTEYIVNSQSSRKTNNSEQNEPTKRLDLLG